MDEDFSKNYTQDRFCKGVPNPYMISLREDLYETNFNTPLKNPYLKFSFDIQLSMKLLFSDIDPERDIYIIQSVLEKAKEFNMYDGIKDFLIRFIQEIDKLPEVNQRNEIYTHLGKHVLELFDKFDISKIILSQISTNRLNISHIQATALISKLFDYNVPDLFLSTIDSKNIVDFFGERYHYILMNFLWDTYYNINELFEEKTEIEEDQGEVDLKDISISFLSNRKLFRKILSILDSNGIFYDNNTYVNLNGISSSNTHRQLFLHFSSFLNSTFNGTKFFQVPTIMNLINFQLGIQQSHREFPKESTKDLDEILSNLTLDAFDILLGGRNSEIFLQTLFRENSNDSKSILINIFSRLSPEQLQFIFNNCRLDWQIIIKDFLIEERENKKSILQRIYSTEESLFLFTNKIPEEAFITFKDFPEVLSELMKMNTLYLKMNTPFMKGTFERLRQAILNIPSQEP